MQKVKEKKEIKHRESRCYLKIKEYLLARTQGVNRQTVILSVPALARECKVSLSSADRVIRLLVEEGIFSRDVSKNLIKYNHFRIIERNEAYETLCKKGAV